jgi:signal transduction histidine kinase
MAEALTILIIDDSPDDRDLCRRALRTAIRTPLRFIEAASGESGLESIAQNNPSCVLLDYSLPGRNGIDILKKLREQHPFVPVVMLTGYGNEAVAVSAMQEGAQNYINKSAISIKTFEQVVRSAIEHCALERRVHEQRESLEIFSRALTHDLREPMRTIRSYVDLIDGEGALPESLNRHFGHIRTAVERMSMLVDTVFRYTQLDNPDFARRDDACDLNGCLSDAQSNLARLMADRGTIVTAGTLPTVNANRAQMIQLFQNLIANATRHGQPKVSIHVSAEERPGQWLISVRDNGPGIAPADREKIFQPFKRLAGAGEEGAGLGLAICRKIAEGHDGRIWCDANPGGGTVFVLMLPRRERVVVGNVDNGGQAETRQETAATASGRIANVLLVDDRSADLEYTELMLTRFGRMECNTLLAHDGGEAISMLATRQGGDRPVDLMLLDVNMPGMDGFEVLEHLSRNEMLGTTTVLMLTGSDLERDKERARSLGVAGYLVKPTRFEDLRPILERLPTLRLQPKSDGYALRVSQ